MALKVIIEGFQTELEDEIKAHEEAITAYRKSITASKQAIMAVYRAEMDEAKAKLEDTRKLLWKADEIASPHEDLDLGIRKVAHQEYAEAAVLVKLSESDSYPDTSELGITTIPYLLGLADSIGEFRRLALESLRRKKLKEAERCLRIMNEIYSELMSLENAYTLAPELRRKCDVARHLIELTLGDVSNEAGRISLEKSVKQLEKRMKMESG